MHGPIQISVDGIALPFVGEIEDSLGILFGIPRAP